MDGADKPTSSQSHKTVKKEESRRINCREDETDELIESHRTPKKIIKRDQNRLKSTYQLEQFDE